MMHNFGLQCEACFKCLADVERVKCDTCDALGFEFSVFCSRECADEHIKTMSHRQLHLIHANPPEGVSPADGFGLGRCLVATRDFAIGEIVLLDEPIASGETWEHCVENLNSASGSSEELEGVKAFFARSFFFLPPRL